MSTVGQKLLTAEEYAALPDPADGTRLELVRGEVVAVSRPNWEHGEVAGNVYMQIKLFLRQHPLGRVTVEGGVVTERGPDTVRGPDVSFMSKERMPLGERMNKYADQTPDLCVEVVSPSNTRRHLNDKVKEYFFTGAKAVWVVDPEERSVTVFHEPMEGRVLKEGATLDGGGVLPGFACRVADLFAYRTSISRISQGRRQLAMPSSYRNIVIRAAIVVLAPISARPTPAADEPSFNGRTLSAWQAVLKDDATPRKRRAAVVALGQIGGENKDSLPAVLQAVGKALRADANPAVREQAADVIGQQKVEDAAAAVADLAEAMRAEKEPAVRRKVAVALGRFGGAAAPAVQPLTAALRDDDPAVRAAAADALGRIGGSAKASITGLLPLLKDADRSVRQAAVFAAGRVEPEDTAGPAAALAGLLKVEQDPTLRREEVVALGLLSDRSPVVVATVAGVLDDKDPELRALAALTLAKFGPASKAVQAGVIQAIKRDADKLVRTYAVRTLCVVSSDDVSAHIPLLAERLREDPDFEVRVAVAEEFGGFGSAGRPALAALRLAQRDSQIKVREAATAAIKRVENPNPVPSRK